MKKTAFLGAILFALPIVASAQTLGPIVVFIQSIAGIINLLIPVMIALAVVTFFWGLVQYVYKSAGEKSAQEGRKKMIAGIASLFVMVSLWGIITLAGNALGISTNNPTPLQAPRVNQ